MIPFMLALQFLTTIPIRIKPVKEEIMAKSMIYFPLIGLLLGLILVSANRLMIVLNFNEFMLSVILVILLVILTGGLHLDGLSDTADAFLSQKKKDEILAIMRDSHIGVMGTLSLICVLLFKIALISSINMPLRTIALLLMCVISRWGMVFSMYLFPYARQEGKAKVFMRGINIKIFILATLITLFCVFAIWGLKGIAIVITLAICVYAIAKFMNTKINGITGDTIGAINELAEVIVLFIIYLSESGNLWAI